MLDDANDKLRMTDGEIANQLDCEPTYLSKIRHGKGNSGPRLTRALERLIKHGLIDTPDSRSHPALAKLAELADVTETKLLERLVKDWGLSTALKMKDEGKQAPLDIVRDEITTAALKVVDAAKTVNPIIKKTK